MVAQREAKEAFVSGLQGTHPFELLLICSALPIGLFLYQNLPRRRVVEEVGTLVIPIVICESNLLYPYGAAYLALELVLALILRGTSKRKTRGVADPHLPLTVYRSGILVLTFVAILACDFHVFPRRFAKTEEQGYSLMDLGAASCIVAAGLVSPRAKGRRASLSLRRTLPLLVMGSIRLVTHKNLEYQEHVSEYGVHWNFFYTLAVVPVLSFCLPGPTGWVPILLMTVYQVVLLDMYNLQTWVMEAPRSCDNGGSLLCDLFVANREGILGCVGYVSLFLVSEWLGSLILWRKSPIPRGLASLVSILGWTALVQWGSVVSRRTTNATFCVWILVVNLSIIEAILFVAPQHPLPMMAAINRNGFVVFVVANLLTGLVNVTMDTMAASDTVALTVVGAYVMVVGGVAFLLDRVSGSKKSGGKEA